MGSAHPGRVAGSIAAVNELVSITTGAVGVYDKGHRTTEAEKDRQREREREASYTLPVTVPSTPINRGEIVAIEPDRTYTYINTLK